ARARRWAFDTSSPARSCAPPIERRKHSRPPMAGKRETGNGKREQLPLVRFPFSVFRFPASLSVRRSSWLTPSSAVVSGLLFSLAFPPLSWLLLLPLALVPWLAALAGEESRGRALVSGVLFGFAYWCASIPW